jgi:hypothetical protein
MPKTRRTAFYQRSARWGLPLLGLLIFAGSLWAIYLQLKRHPFQEVISSLEAISRDRIFTAIVLTILSYLVLTVYDVLACRYIRHPLAASKAILAAFLGHAISNSTGFALLTGSVVRYRLYAAWGLSPVEIAQVVAFSNISFWLGLFAVGGVVLLVEPLAIPTLLHLPFASARSLGVIFLVLVSGYMAGSIWLKRPLRIRQWAISFPSLWFALAQLVIASLDWVLAGAVLYVLLQPTVTLSYSSFFGIYLLGQLAGFVSNVPGGLGVFEGFVLWFLSANFPVADIFGALLVYRTVYYLLPLAIALVILGCYEVYQRVKLSR